MNDPRPLTAHMRQDHLDGYRIERIVFGRATFDRERTVREIGHLLRAGIGDGRPSGKRR